MLFETEIKTKCKCESKNDIILSFGKQVEAYADFKKIKDAICPECNGKITLLSFADYLVGKVKEKIKEGEIEFN